MSSGGLEMSVCRGAASPELGFAQPDPLLAPGFIPQSVPSSPPQLLLGHQEFSLEIIHVGIFVGMVTWDLLLQ